MGEIITVQVGQCGNQIGQVLWPHVLHEYGLIEKVNSKQRANYNLNSFFYNPKGEEFRTIDEMKKHRIKARALLVDMEDSVVERFQSWPLNFLFDKACTLSSYPGSGNNWAVGHFTHGEEQGETFLNMVQSSVEKCDSLKGFLCLFSLGGGTGSGLGSAVVKMLEENYPRNMRLVCCVHPGENHDVVTAPYNIALCLSKLKQHASFVLPVDNKVLLGITSRTHCSKEMKLWKPYRNVNTIISKLLLDVTSGVRFAGQTSFDVCSLVNNMVPFKSMQFLASSLSPITFVKEQDIPVNQRQCNIYVDLCCKSNQLMSVAPTKGMVNSVCLVARGDISEANLKTYSIKMRDRVKWAPWSSRETCTVSCSLPPYGLQKSLTCLSNTELMADFFVDTLTNFYRLYRKKAHVHHYAGVNGFNDSFAECTEHLHDVINTYTQNRIDFHRPTQNLIT